MLLHSVSCPSSVLMHSHSSASPSDSRSQTPIFESKEAVASDWPDGAHATARTVFACPVGILVIGLKVTSNKDEPSDTDGVEVE